MGKGAMVLDRLNQMGVRVRRVGEQLCVDAPIGVLDDSMRAQIRESKSEILEALQEAPSEIAPHINSRGDLVIPFESPKKYHWWNGGQSVDATLRELGVSKEIWRRYTDLPY